MGLVGFSSLYFCSFLLVFCWTELINTANLKFSFEHLILLGNVGISCVFNFDDALNWVCCYPYSHEGCIKPVFSPGQQAAWCSYALERHPWRDSSCSEKIDRQNRISGRKTANKIITFLLRYLILHCIAKVIFFRISRSIGRHSE